MASHATLEKTNVNTYGLVYHWKGSDPELKPLLLTAHQGEKLSFRSLIGSGIRIYA